MEVHPANVKEEMMSLNPRKSTFETLLPLSSKVPIENNVSANDENLKPMKLVSDNSPNDRNDRNERGDKPKKQIMFQADLQENERRDSRLQDFLRDKRQSAMPPPSGGSRNRTSSPVKAQEKEVDVFKLKEEFKNKRLVQLEAFLESKWLQVPITLLTIYALFFGDVKYLISDKSADSTFDVMTFLCMGVFTFEIIVSMLVKKHYTFSFFFWLDIVSTATLIFDLSILSTKIFGSSTSLARASRATKIGSRAGRVVRLIRLIRIVKLWKSIRSNENAIALNRIQNDPTLNPGRRIQAPDINVNSYDKNSVDMSPSRAQSPLPMTSAQMKSPSVFQLKVMPAGGSPNENDAILENNNSQLAANNNSILVARNPSVVPKYSTMRSPSVSPSRYSEWERIQNLNPEEDELNLKESRVGKKLSELTTKRVVILVLVLIFIVPLFQSTYFFDPDKAYTIGIKVLANMAVSGMIPYETFMQMYTNYTAPSLYTSSTEPVIYVYLPIYPSLTFQTYDPSLLRDDEKEETHVSLDQYSDDFISIVDLREKARFNAVLNITRTIFVCFVLTAASYYFSKDANNLALKPIEQMIIRVNKIASNPLASKEEAVKEKTKEEMQFETTLIENAIIKIGTLLALGFGDAGSEIIASNMAKGGDVDPMIAGKRRCAVFGFCDIRSFTDTTEVLQEEVMMFVNSIAQIVHKTVDKYGGAANKNIGDAFLLVYKFPPDEVETLPDGNLELKRTRVTKNVADLSVISFLKIIAGINKKPQVLKYRYNEKLTARMPNYKVKMGFGLHFGWAIEGAIGSEFKIDASYLSPNVNMASRLEAATKQYGVPLLISNELHRILSKKTQRLCREIDRVTVKGSKKPIGLFTVDVDISVLQPSVDKGFTKNELKEKHKLAKEAIGEMIFGTEEEGGLKASNFFDVDKDLLKMMENVFGAFRNTFSEAFDNYVKGDWGACKSKLDLCFNQRPEDGPSLTILGVLKEQNFMAPSDWQGFRVLTEK